MNNSQREGFATSDGNGKLNCGGQVDNVGTSMTKENQSLDKAFLTLKEAADYANCSTGTLRRAVHSKALAHHRFGVSETRGKILIKATDLQAFLDGCRLTAH